ncbi:hypothetical protein, partial [Dialister invisus]
MIQKYKNKKTGATIDATSLMGGDWALHVEKTRKVVEAEEVQKELEDTENVETDSVEQEVVVEEPEEATDNV